MTTVGRKLILPLLIVLGVSVASTFAGTAAASASPPGKAEASKGKRKGHSFSVMTRNLYLGADLGPAIAATSTDQFIDENGKILRDVDDNDFPLRARGIAKEILARSPDLVGLQEAALWRTGPVDLLAPTTGNFTASEVKYDYLKILMDQLNKGKKRYRVVKVQNEFDFEAPADYNAVAGDGNVPGINSNGEINGRLTMRDAILVKRGAGIITAAPGGANFSTVYQPVISGIPVTVNRGWVNVYVKVRKSRWFNFVNTHLEAFGEPAIREAQAKELVDEDGPLNTRLPGVLVGDLNSDDNTVEGDDRLAYNALIAAGLRDRSTETPLSCCVKSDLLGPGYGSLDDFDHHIDHILTDRPKRVKKISSAVTGRKQMNGFWNSDHAGVYSMLKITR